MRLAAFVMTAVLALAIALVAPAHRAQAACTSVSDVNELQNIASDPTGSYCLAQDIDAASATNFQPIPNFSGDLAGGGHVIRNLSIRCPDANQSSPTGLFASINGGSVEDLGLANVRINGQCIASDVGGLAATIGGTPGQPGAIHNVHVTGNVSGPCEGTAGGLVGVMSADTSVADSWSSARVSLPCGGDDLGAFMVAGGLVGTLGSGATITRSFATGRVFGQFPASVGGLVGTADAGTIFQSFAAGPVAPENSGGGGLIGIASGTTVTQSFALGSVTGACHGPLGGLIGRATSVQVTQVYAAGLVANTGSQRCPTGGLIARSTGSGDNLSNSYWDIDTTGQSTTAVGGVGLSTVELQRRLPPGFAAATWGITAQHSYPYLPGMALIAPLSTVVHNDGVFVFLPIGQRDVWEYRTAPMHADGASEAAAFTMIARAIGTTNDISQLRNAKIDGPFWDDTTQMASFRGPVTQYAMLGQLTPIPAATPIGSNVVGPMKLGKLVLLRGTYRKPDHTLGTHWLLGTLFTRNPDRTLAAIVALDPWTGAQVMVDPTTKAVTSPAPFPLRNFKVNGFQPVTLK